MDRLRTEEQAGDPVRYLELLSPLVASGPGEAIWLWYGALIELVNFCQELDLAEARLLWQELVADMDGWKWSGLPVAWKDIPARIAV